MAEFYSCLPDGAIFRFGIRLSMGERDRGTVEKIEGWVKLFPLSVFIVHWKNENVTSLAK